MHKQFTKLKDVTRHLHPTYRNQIERAGPLIGALELDAYFHKVPSPPSPSPIGAHLRAFRYKTWRNISKHMSNLRREGIRHMGRSAFDLWSKRIVELAADKDLLLAYTVALFVEGQAVTIAGSPHPALDVLLSLLEPVIASDGALSIEANPQEKAIEPANASITVCLHAGKVPFALTCHTKATMSRWFNELEAATVLLIPQVVIYAESILPSQGKLVMRNALKAELQAWSARLPRPGEQRDWEWLPRLM